MTETPLFRMIIFTGILLLGVCAGTYAFLSPENIQGASRSAISALSIIFGLSTAVSSMLMSSRNYAASTSKDPHLAKSQDEQAQRDDNRTLTRQKALHLITIATIILGIIYLVAVEAAPCGTATRVFAFLFSCGAIVCLLSTMFLPSLLTLLIRRNAFLKHGVVIDKDGQSA